MIDDKLMQLAQRASGLATKRAVVHRGLELLAQVGAQARIRRLRGKVAWEGDLDRMRTSR